MKITILSHNLSSNAVMRAHRLAVAARHFAEVKLIGPVELKGLWPALPSAPWIKSVVEKRFPRFFASFVELVEVAEGDVMIAVKPHLASFGVALVSGEKKQIPVILDVDDLDISFFPRSQWASNPATLDLHRHGSPVYLSLLTRAAPVAAAVTVASTALQQRFGGTLVPHGCLTELFDPSAVNVEEARKEFGFTGPTVLFAGTPRLHKGLKHLAKAVRKNAGVTLAVLCRRGDLAESEWTQYPLQRVPMMPYQRLPRLLAAADIVAIPQLDTEAGRHQMPMKVYDCMAMGKPIIATTVSDMPAVLERCALLVPPGDVWELRHAITSLLRKPEKARQLGARARARCLKSFTMQRVGEKLFEVVDHVLQQFREEHS